MGWSYFQVEREPPDGPALRNWERRIDEDIEEERARLRAMLPMPDPPTCCAGLMAKISSDRTNVQYRCAHCGAQQQKERPR